MNLLFITRKYPPMVGGMENLSYALSKEFSKNVNATSLTWGGSQKYLLYVLISFFIKSLILIPSKKITHIHLGDALLAPLGLLLKTIFPGIKVTTTVCGLDITFDFLPYQLIVPRCVSKLDKAICISNLTLNECLKRGIPKNKCTVITCGVYPQDFRVKAKKENLGKITGIKKITDKKILITVGRLVPRKGVYWFIKNVFLKLGKEYVYLVVGDGPERPKIEGLIKDLDLNDRVKLLGKLPDKDLKVIYNTADKFVMPNVRIKDDVEGFGIVAVEASSAGLPVIASDLQGIKDAVLPNRTGFLVKPENPDDFVEKIVKSSLPKELIKRSVDAYYSWDVIIKKYRQNFAKL